MAPKLLGRYEHFPGIIHGIAYFTCRSSAREVQRGLLGALYKLNIKVFSLNDIATLSSPRCEVSFEFGIAGGMEFSYLDEEELDRLRRSIVKKELPVLDIFCVVRYHIQKEEERVPLRFDYHILRFIFRNKNELELWISHQRGVQHVSVGELITFITKRVNEELSQSELKPLQLKRLKAL